jgi:DNA-binding MarR family transcriptional regulator
MILSTREFITYHRGMNTVTPPRDPEHLAAELVQHVFDLSRALEDHVRTVLRELDLTKVLADVLWQLDPAREPLSRKDLAARLHCDPSNVTFLADRLEGLGYLERVLEARDRRFKAMRLTSAGAEARSQLLRRFMIDSPFAQLTASEQRLLADLLARSVEGRLPASAGPGVAE